MGVTCHADAWRRNLEPGGWLELADILLEFKTDDNTIPADSAALRWGDLMLEAAEKFGAPLDSCKRYKQQLADAGFVDIVETVYKWPSYAWPKDPKFKEMGKWISHALKSPGWCPRPLTRATKRVIGL